MTQFSFSETRLIGSNRHGWTFGIGQLGEHWVGFALGDGFLNIMAEVSEGFQLGLKDADLAMRMTSAVAVDPEQLFGGVDRWFIPEQCRGDPEDYRCEVCGEIGCDCRLEIYESLESNL